jgi:cell volume regulation protein A
VKLKENSVLFLNLRCGSNDPMAYFLTITLTGIIASDQFDTWNFLFLLVKGFLIGGTMGYCMGRISHWIINKYKIGE